LRGCDDNLWPSDQEIKTVAALHHSKQRHLYFASNYRSTHCGIFATSESLYQKLRGEGAESDIASALKHATHATWTAIKKQSGHHLSKKNVNCSRMLQG
jgi:hypothetical protein